MNRDQLLAARKCRVEEVEVEGIGKVHIRAISARTALTLEADVGNARKDESGGLPTLVAAQLAAFLCDADGNAVLSKEEATQLLDIWSGPQVQAVIYAGIKLNALGERSVEEAGGN